MKLLKVCLWLHLLVVVLLLSLTTGYPSPNQTNKDNFQNNNTNQSNKNGIVIEVKEDGLVGNLKKGKKKEPALDDPAEDDSAKTKCISPGVFFDPVNLVTEEDFMNTGGSTSNGTEQNDGSRYEGSQFNQSDEWRKMVVNQYYAVFRDRFFVRNMEGLITIQLRDGEPTSKATLYGVESDWRHEYTFARANIFYSLNNNFGAMHSIWGVTYSLEIQYVHYKKSYRSLEDAAKQKHGVLVICILFESTGKQTPYMDALVAAAIMSIFPSDRFHVAHGPLDLKALFPVDMTNLQYTGENLASPCAREAKFVVLLSPRQVSEKQMAKFREVRDHEGQTYGGNFGDFMEDSVKEGIKTTLSRNIRLQVEHTEHLAATKPHASLFPILITLHFIPLVVLNKQFLCLYL